MTLFWSSDDAYGRDASKEADVAGACASTGSLLLDISSLLKHPRWRSSASGGYHWSLLYLYNWNAQSFLFFAVCSVLKSWEPSSQPQEAHWLYAIFNTPMTSPRLQSQCGSKSSTTTWVSTAKSFSIFVCYYAIEGDAKIPFSTLTSLHQLETPSASMESSSIWRQNWRRVIPDPRGRHRMLMVVR